jgi:hypothetical protein
MHCQCVYLRKINSSEIKEKKRMKKEGKKEWEPIFKLLTKHIFCDCALISCYYTKEGHASLAT